MKEEMSYENIGKLLIGRVPEFIPNYEEHIKDNTDVLPHVLMGDFTRFFVDLLQRSTASVQWKSALERSANFIEELLSSGDPKLEELAVVSFVENLPQVGSNIEAAKKYLGPLALKALESV